MWFANVPVTLKTDSGQSRYASLKGYTGIMLVANALALHISVVLESVFWTVDEISSVCVQCRLR